jgi:hypothetical protein
MPTVVIVSIGLGALGVLIGVVWRLASRRESLPYPSWLRRMVELDDPFKDQPIPRHHRALGPAARCGDSIAYTVHLLKPTEATLTPRHVKRDA